MMNKSAKIYVAGHRGMVGSAIHRNLKAKGFTNIITRTSKELDLRNQEAVKSFFCDFVCNQGTNSTYEHRRYKRLDEYKYE